MATFYSTTASSISPSLMHFVCSSRTGDVINNWENAAHICYELVQHCPPLREYWDLNCMFGCREHNPNPKVQDIMEKAESIRYLQLKEQVRAEKMSSGGRKKK